MKFHYEARTKEGEPQVGFVEAGNQETAVNLLSSHDLFVLKIESTEVSHWYDRIGAYFGGVKRQEMVVFTRQLSTLLEARLSLSKALQTLREQTRNERLREAINQISHDVDSGLSFSQALERQDAIFSGFFVSMIRTAEVPGNLEKVSGFLADYTERASPIISKARSALVYPGIIIALFGVVAVLMVTMVFPQLKPVFEESNVDLPLLSKILINSGDFLAQWWFALIITFGVLLGMLLDYLGTSEGRAFLDDMKIRMPIAKKMYLPLTLTRFANAAAMLMKGGVPIAQAIEIVGQTVDNILYRDVLHEVAEDIRQGTPLSDALSKYPDYFPALVSQMIAVGETTGQLDQILERISNFYARETDAVVNNLVDLIQPIVMIVIGLMIGLLFGSVLIPLYKLTGSIR